ncbi:MAG: TonB-dependent receptor, partial [Rhodospirillaceae bacterium]|nr:TonB-dependent receptor [Rhodospirillaceae bacterium]
GAGFSPFFSYTESFLPIAGSLTNPDGSIGDPFVPQTGTQFEGGVKWQPGRNTLVTVTAFHIKERNRVLYLSNGATTQSGELKTKGIETEASHTLPGDFELLVNYGYSKLRLDPYGLNPAIPAGTLYTVVTPSRTTVDALAEITWDKWRFAINATNLLDKRYFASCLARGDCFMAAPRNVMATMGVRF